MPTSNEQRGDVLQEWQFPEFQRHMRGRSWYVWFIIIIVGALAFAWFIQDYTFMIVVVLLALIITVRLRRTPPLVRFAIREEGVEVSDRFYPWNELKEFWILYRPPEVKKLYLHFKSALRPAMDIALVDQNPLRIRQFLSENLPENTTREEEPAGDQVSRYLKI